MSVSGNSAKRLITSSARMLWRQRNVASVRLLFLSLCLAVMTVTTLSMVSSQLNQAMLGSATRFMAGDRQLISPRKVDQSWLSEAESFGLIWSQSLEFASMLYAGDNMQLVSVKAVDERYPLKGELQIEEANGVRQAVPKGPDSGQLWLQSRLFSLLDIQPDQNVYVGDLSLTPEHILAQEPDAGFQVFGLAPRVLMNWADIDATGVVQVGSRLTWRYYFTGEPKNLEAYDRWIEDKLNQAQRWEGVKEGRPAISDALRKTETYLLLGGSLAVLLACVAIAMAARQFSLEQINQVALMKTLGQLVRQIIAHYVWMLILLAALASLIGVAVSLILADMLTTTLQSWVPELEFSETEALSPRVIFLALGTTLVALMGFALPEFFQLRHVAPMQVLRQEKLTAMAWSWKASLGSILSIFALLYFYGGNLKLISLLLVALVAVFTGITVLALLIYYFASKRNLQGNHVSTASKHAIFNLLRRRWHTLIQLCVFSFAMLLLAIIWLARDSLIQDWQSQLPEDTPNHFLINIDPAALENVKGHLAENQIQTTGLYPMVRGRLSHINDESVKEAVTKDDAALNRELNLTWSAELPEDNEIEEGSWWPSEAGVQGVSVESQLADRLDLEMGDKLLFNVGGRELTAVITSIRSVQWDSMRPNFYMMFEPGALRDFPATYITSFYMSDDQKAALNDLGRSFPTVSILELDQLVEKVRTMIDQVSVMIEVILVFIFCAALLVMSALISVSTPERMREAALLRTLGAERKMITMAQFSEFALLAGLSAFIAIVCAEFSMAMLQTQLFGSSFRFHWWLWLFMPLGAAVLIGIIAYWQIRKVPNTSPMVILRSGEQAN